MRFIKSFCTHSAAFLATVVAAFAVIGTDLQMQTGNPSSATADANNHTHYLINRAQYALDYNDTTREPNWVAWDYTIADSGGSGRAPDFYQDTTLPAGFYQVKNTDYSGSGYDRGHMCPSADRTITTADNTITFYMSNMVPQSPDNNQGVWASFETYTRTVAAAGNEVLIICGPSGFAGSKVASGVSIPGYTWKIAVIVPTGSGTALSRIDANTRVIAIKVPNIAGVRSTPWQNFITSAAQLQTDTGFTFFSALSTPIANALRTKVDGASSVGSPAITAQPAGVSAPVGGTATFTVAATGNATLTYQWFKDDAEVTGATGTTLTLTNIQLADAGTYTAVVTNSIGSATSNGAVLVISGVAPSIVTSPVTKSVAAGSTTTFTVAASGSPTLTYQWRKGGTNLANGTGISGATTAVLTLANVQAAAAGSYDAVVTNSVSSATSAAATLTVTPAAPTIVTQPTAQTAALASTATFTVVATGTAPLTYQWRKGGTAITGNASATTATLTIAGVAAGDAGTYDVVVSNGVNPSFTSNAVTLTIGSSSAGGSYNYAGGTYAQDFDTLPASGTFTFATSGPFGFKDTQPNGVGALGMTGWSFVRYAGTGSAALFRVDDGSLNNGSIYSYGAGTSTDRALGSLASVTTISRFGFTLVNTTGQTITQFTITYTGEQWRRGSAAANVLTFAYAVGAADINDSGATFTNVAALNFTGLFTNTTTTGTIPVDGNASANRVTGITSTVTGITWAPGQSLVIRWTDVDDTGSDDGLAIDDFTFTTPVAGAPAAPAVLQTSPANAATGVPGNSAITVTFDSPVTITGSWFTIASAFNGSVAATVTGGPKVFTLTPPINFAESDTVTVSILAAGLVDQATGTVHPAADTTFSFTTAAAIAPTITTQPVAQTVNAGATATFTVAASGTAPFAYQWKKGGVAITGNASATTATLTLTNAQAADAGSYTVTVANGVSPDAVSAAVALTVTAVAPTIVTQPAGHNVSVGDSATFTVVATGTAPFAYQWRKGGVNLANSATISGATTATLTLSSLTVADGGDYTVVVSNGVSPSATSSVATLYVDPNAPGPQLNYVGGTYTQNFNTLPSSGGFAFTGNGPFPVSGATPPAGIGASGMVGWTFANYAGTGNNALIGFDDGTSSSGSVVSYGTAGATDRAFGSLASGAQVGRIGLTLVNTTGATITQFTLGYTGEQWRNGGNTNAQALTFAYSVGATDINTGTFTNATSLDFTSPVVSASGTTPVVLDGNLAANRTVIAPVTITGISWAPGATLVLRWTDINDSGNDHGLAIDDLTFTTPAAAAAQTITFAQPANHVSTDAPFALVATASSGLPVTFTVVSGPATVSGNTLTLTGTAGSVVIRASQAGNGSFQAAAVVDRTITVTAPVAVAQTITFAQPADHYTIDQPFALTATASSGLTVTFAVVSGPATVSGNTVTLTGTAGSVVIRASQAGNAAYLAATDVTRTIAVTAPPSLAGTYFGTFASGGNWALYVRSDRTATYIAYLPSRSSAIVSNFTINVNGTFSIAGTEVKPTASAVSGYALANPEAPVTRTAAAGSSYTLAGTIAADGSVTGGLTGLSETFTGAAAASTGAAQASAGLYTASALGTASGTTYAIVGASGQAVIVTTTPTSVDGATGTVNASGALTATTSNNAALSLAINPSTHTISASVTPSGSSTAVTYGGVGSTVTPIARVVNLSVRTPAGTGDQTLIVGMVIIGSGNKTLLLRGIGPTLSTQGVTNPLADPTMRLLNSGGVEISANNDWGGSAQMSQNFASVGAFALPANSKDAALYNTLSTGLYSFHTYPNGAGTGVVLAEVYDADDDSSAASVFNISARTQVGIGENILIAGFVITGNSPKTLLIRGLGPTLASQGVTGALVNPQLYLFGSAGLLANNDDWGGTAALKAAFAATGAGALVADNSKDAALLVTLQPGVYSAQVSGVGSTTGVGLVEIYLVP
jgi:DNA/RNA endonuclease G (NUC1)